MKQTSVRKVFLEDLPRWKGGKLIKWKYSIGYKVKFIYEDISGEIEIIDYKNGYVYIKYQDKEPFKISTDNFKNCLIGKMLGKRTSEFKIEISQVFKDDKRDLIILDRKKKGSFKFYKYHCNKCGFTCGEHYKNGEYKEDLWIIERSLLNGNGCACCCPTPRIVVPTINSIVANEETHWMISYFQNPEDAKKYTYSSGQEIHPICPDCGRVKDKNIMVSTIYRTKSIGCSCGDGFSYGHKYIFSLLEQLNVEFTDNKTFNWCKFYNSFKNRIATGEYDFIIENMKLVIEVDGSWHRQDNNKSGQTKEESEFIDDIKEKLADENGYKAVKVFYDDKNMEIKKYIINSELTKLFDLSNIDWELCEEFALSNRVREACELKNNNPEMTAREIGEIMSLDNRTIFDYLKKGSKLGWCSINKKFTCKLVGIFKGNEPHGIFESCRELERKSEELFGIKLDSRKISLVCLGKKPQYKGFTFKYIENNKNI